MEVKEISLIYSMTGFGKGTVEQDGWEFTSEIKSLNNRYLDVNIRLPRNLSYLEADMRKLVQQNISRGRIDFTLLFVNAESDSIEVNLNQELAKAYLDCVRRLVEKFHLKNDLSVSTFINLPDMIITRRKDENAEVLNKLALQSLQQALTNLELMKMDEGKKLKANIVERLRFVENFLVKIEQRAPALVEEYRHRLKDRLKDLLSKTELEESRFNMEVVFFAEKSSIAEEIVRLYSHIFQFEKILEAGGSVGRKLDFLVQEMNREINTIGSKVSDLIVVNMVVEIKSEIEKIREQIQNIE